MSKRTMTLNLTDDEMHALEELCEKKGLSKTALVRQALRMYQAIDARLRRGDKLLVENDESNEKTELMVF